MVVFSIPAWLPLTLSLLPRSSGLWISDSQQQFSFSRHRHGRRQPRPGSIAEDPQHDFWNIASSIALGQHHKQTPATKPREGQAKQVWQWRGGTVGQVIFFNGLGLSVNALPIMGRRHLTANLLGNHRTASADKRPVRSVSIKLIN
jgi:hypothetical protein